MLSERWDIDVQEIEGVNSMISGITSTARNVHLPLLSSLVGIGKELGSVGANSNMKWSTFQDPR
eukprot:8088736-Lingulodinium_polyedra.AAC.1